MKKSYFTTNVANKRTIRWSGRQQYQEHCRAVPIEMPTYPRPFPGD